MKFKVRRIILSSFVSLAFFMSPNSDAIAFETLKLPAEIRPPYSQPNGEFFIVGYVSAGSLRTNNFENHSFFVQADRATTAVNYNGILPDLFSDNEPVLLGGTMGGDVFEATSVWVLSASSISKYIPEGLILPLKDLGFLH